MKVQDKLSGEVFETEEVRYVTRGVLARDTWFKPFEVVRVDLRAEPAPHREAWARATDGGEVRWLPVEVL